MELSFNSNDGAAVISIAGRLDTVTAPELDDYINARISGIETLTIDCAGLEYISSAGLRVLLRAHKKMSAGGSMKLINVGPIVSEIFEITGFNEILTIE
ncbi:MAG: STAS domain-containing protein [Clostridia bacterium]|nr:STAS domain-containing protein [Clostridia bacterium]MBQ3938117.1 STAS domain-containing protein [Clostridia bacterium]